MMKKQLVILFLVFGSGILHAQQIPNGGFEVINDNEFNPDWPYPQNWLPGIFFSINTVCEEEMLSGSLSDDSHSGSYSIKMETIVCEETINGSGFYPGGFRTGNSGTFSPYPFALDFTERPDQLDFYYKFHRESTDSAFVEVMLFNYDSVTPDIPASERIDTVGYAIEYIVEPTENYELYLLPLDYLTESFPSFISINFGTGRECNFSNCTPGTSLWVDDVTVSGGTLGTRNADAIRQQFSVYPNPSSDWFRIGSASETQITTVTLCDYQGRAVKRWKGKQDQFVIDGLAQGSYLIRIETEKGIVVKRLVKTD